MQPTLEQLDDKLNMLIDMMGQLLTALTDDQDDEPPAYALDGSLIGNERDQNQTL